MSERTPFITRRQTRVKLNRVTLLWDTHERLEAFLSYVQRVESPDITLDDVIEQILDRFLTGGSQPAREFREDLEALGSSGADPEGDPAPKGAASPGEPARRAAGRSERSASALGAADPDADPDADELEASP